MTCVTGAEPLNLTGAEPLNMAVLAGIVSQEPRSHALPSGDWLMAFDLRVPSVEGRRQSIPVSWIGPETKVPRLEAEADVMVIGELRRRFYRTNGSLGSQVDVRAIRIVKTVKARRKALAALL